MFKLTIGLTVFNGEKTLPKTLSYLDSLLSKSKDIACVISLDLSSDSSLELISDFVNKHPIQSKLFVQQNRIGLLSNYLYVLENSDTDFFSWLSQDDYHDLDWFEVHIKNLESNTSYSLAYGLTIPFGNTANHTHNMNMPKFFVTRKKSWVKTILFYILPGSINKANLIYSVFYLPKTKSLMCKFFKHKISNCPNYFAFDTELCTLLIDRYNIVFDKNTTMFKYLDPSSFGNERFTTNQTRIFRTLFNCFREPRTLSLIKSPFYCIRTKILFIIAYPLAIIVYITTRIVRRL